MKSISKKVTGAYEPVVELEDGKLMGLVSYVKDLAGASVGNPGDVVDAVHINNNQASSATTAAEFQFDKDNPPAQLIHAPTLEELGYDEDGYELRAILIANVRTNNANEDVQLRVVDALGDPVPGSSASATIEIAAQDQVVKSSPFSITPGGGYAIDLRLVQATEGHNATLFAKNLLIQVVKKALA
jgi:hypothetical protein